MQDELTKKINKITENVGKDWLHVLEVERRRPSLSPGETGVTCYRGKLLHSTLQARLQSKSGNHVSIMFGGHMCIIRQSIITIRETIDRMRTYKRKTDRGRTAIEIYRAAAREVIENKKSLRIVAADFDINFMTLQRFCKKIKNEDPNGPKPRVGEREKNNDYGTTHAGDEQRNDGDTRRKADEEEYVNNYEGEADDETENDVINATDKVSNNDNTKNVNINKTPPHSLVSVSGNAVSEPSGSGVSKSSKFYYSPSDLRPFPKADQRLNTRKGRKKQKRSASTQLNKGVGVLRNCSSINLEQTDLSASNNSPNYQDYKSNDVFLKKILNYVIILKNQNEQIIEALKNTTSTSVTNPTTSYLKTISGSDAKNKTNIILRKLISNAVALKFSFLISRQEKKAFSKLTLHLVLINTLLTDDFKEKDINDCIKIWLKHAPKRLSSSVVKLQTKLVTNVNSFVLYFIFI
ncbi:hypothetical protein RN001_005924 [Aquatica leii]|uniref:Uncharacterized protein n=1 Tax=Aquatica leii TaxID=1421715 RepID=A0AAN7Q8F3_9COLE|nr:hypothetical protein RN001_005924 [Aquatica leii]